ncbi:hypothetical protein PDE_05074 [Penicillium oxalicum 114-2]|uniref:Uncharacterized protein n=1 Tax=Penicillium oxalicum (strain 114-2 / CGMCC 5302) TaxID=933388 RepID=S7ZIK5_PENO1|nr:hypothetical protein PDE_05074 [Penicillium oxalicum 114-2]
MAFVSHAKWNAVGSNNDGTLRLVVTWRQLIGVSLSEWKRYGAGPRSPVAYVCVYVYLIKQPILTAKSKLKYFTSSDGPSEAEWRKALT